MNKLLTAGEEVAMPIMIVEICVIMGIVAIIIILLIIKGGKIKRGSKKRELKLFKEEINKIESARTREREVAEDLEVKKESEKKPKKARKPIIKKLPAIKPTVKELPSAKRLVEIPNKKQLIKDFEEESGKRAVWRGKETKAFIKWKKEKYDI